MHIPSPQVKPLTSVTPVQRQPMCVMQSPRHCTPKCSSGLCSGLMPTSSPAHLMNTSTLVRKRFSVASQVSWASVCLEDISVTMQHLKHSKEGRGRGGRGEGGRRGEEEGEGGGRGEGILIMSNMFWLELHGNFSLTQFIETIMILILVILIIGL